MYRTLFYVNIYDSYKLSKTVRFFLAHPVYIYIYIYIHSIHSIPSFYFRQRGPYTEARYIYIYIYTHTHTHTYIYIYIYIYNVYFTKHENSWLVHLAVSWLASIGAMLCRQTGPVTLRWCPLWMVSMLHFIVRFSDLHSLCVCEGDFCFCLVSACSKAKCSLLLESLWFLFKVSRCLLCLLHDVWYYADDVVSSAVQHRNCLSWAEMLHNNKTEIFHCCAGHHATSVSSHDKTDHICFVYDELL